MKFLLLVFSVASQAAQLCSKPVEYSTCTTEAHKQMAACSANVQGNPKASYYRCLCNGQNSLVSCYAICGDDPNLLLQLPTAQRDAATSCKVASEQEAKEPAATSTSMSNAITMTLPTKTEQTPNLFTIPIPTFSLTLPTIPLPTATAARPGGVVVFSHSMGMSSCKLISIFILMAAL